MKINVLITATFLAITNAAYPQTNTNHAALYSTSRAGGMSDEPGALETSPALSDGASGSAGETGEPAIKRNGQLMLLPIVFSSPDTRLALGVLPQYVFRISPESRSSSVRMDAYYTFNRQFHVQLASSFWLPDNLYQISGKISFKDWPTSYYGVGSNTPSENEQAFTERMVNGIGEVQRQIKPDIFVGAKYELRWNRIADVDSVGPLQPGSVTGSRGGLASGVGAMLSWDTRSHVFYPSTGHNYRVGVNLFGPAIGSDYTFARVGLDFRQYFSLSGSHVLAMRTVAQFTTGDPPFRMMPSVGSSLRAYSTTRYIDRHNVSVQAEYRIVPLWWRIGAVAFAGVGDVADRPGSFNFENPKYAVGLGLRFQFSRTEMINIRWDFGFGRGASGDYLDLNEAF